MGSALVRKYEIRLTEEQRKRLLDCTRNGMTSTKKIMHARVLLLSDRAHLEGQRTDTYIAEVLDVHLNTVKRIRKRFIEGGEKAALQRKVRPAPPPKIDGHVEAHLVAICCSAAPEGRERWTLTLLVSELERRGLATVCRETVRKALKKIRLSRGGRNAGAFQKRTQPVLSPKWKKYWTSTWPSTARTSL
jgi:transposase